MSEIAKVEIHNLTFEIYNCRYSIIAHNKLLNLEFVGIIPVGVDNVFVNPEIYSNYEIVNPVDVDDVDDVLKLKFDDVCGFEDAKKIIINNRITNLKTKLINNLTEKEKEEQDNLTLIDFYCNEEDNIFKGYIDIMTKDNSITLKSTSANIIENKKVNAYMILRYIDYDLHIITKNTIYNTRTKLKIYFDENIYDELNNEAHFINIESEMKFLPEFGLCKIYHLKIERLIDNKFYEKIISTKSYEIL
jgi:hypothetical protein